MAHAAFPEDQVQFPTLMSGGSRLLTTLALVGTEALCFHRHHIQVHMPTHMHIIENKANFLKIKYLRRSKCSLVFNPSSTFLPMADQRMDISSTISDFMSPGPTDLLSGSLGTSGVDCNRKRKGSATDYQ